MRACLWMPPTVQETWYEAGCERYTKKSVWVPSVQSTFLALVNVIPGPLAIQGYPGMPLGAGMLGTSLGVKGMLYEPSRSVPSQAGGQAGVAARFRLHLGQEVAARDGTGTSG